MTNAILTCSESIRPSPGTVSEFFCLSLLQQERQHGLITSSSLQQFQHELMQLLQHKIRNYTRAESSSVRIETAEHLMRSILYTLDLLLSSCSDDQESLELLRKIPVADLYDRGLALLLIQVEASQTIYQEVVDNMLNIGTYAYSSTIMESIPEFFRNYDPYFSAHDTVTGIDYPLLNDDSDASGISYIKQYLEKLSLENRFCQAFPPADISRLLHRYGNIYTIDYRDTLTNIAEIILSNSVFGLLAGNRVGDIDISPAQFSLLREMLSVKFDQEIWELLDAAQRQLINVLGLTEWGSADYWAGFCETLTARVLNARDNDTMTNVIIVNEPPQNRLSISFSQGPNLDSQGFRKLVDEILVCRDSSAKVALIHDQVKSLDDLQDVLEADCLYTDDLLALFCSLDDLELSVLVRVAMSEDLRCLELKSFLHGNNLTCGYDWPSIFKFFLAGLPASRISTLQRIIASF